MMWNSRVLVGLVLVCIGLATVSGEAKPKANPDPKAKADPKADAKAKAKAQWGQPMYDPRRVVADVRSAAYDPRAAARADPRRVDPRRAAAYDPRRVDPRRADPRRVDPRRADPRRADPRRADPRRADPRRADPRRVDPRRADPRRAPAYDPRRAPSRTPYVPRAAPQAPRRAPAPYVPRPAPRRAPAPYAAPRQAASGQWGPWSNTGACSVTCGSGWQGRKRTCSAGPRGCPGKNNEYVACVLSPCQSAATRGTQAARPPTMTYTDPRNSPNGVLNSYDPRVAPVAPRRADPRRADPRRADPRRADPRRADPRRQPVAPRRAPYVPQRRVSAGSWAPWRSSGGCSVTCGKGWERRARECIGGTAGRGGCPGKYSEFVECQKQACVSRSRSVPSYQPRRQPDRRQPVYQPRRQPVRQPFRQQVRQPVYQPTRVQSGVRACDRRPCRNGGRCTDSFGGQYRCQCMAGYEGTNCEIVSRRVSPVPDAVRRSADTRYDPWRATEIKIDPRKANPVVWRQTVSVPTPRRQVPRVTPQRRVPSVRVDVRRMPERRVEPRREPISFEPRPRQPNVRRVDPRRVDPRRVDPRRVDPRRQPYVAPQRVVQPRRAEPRRVESVRVDPRREQYRQWQNQPRSSQPRAGDPRDPAAWGGRGTCPSTHPFAFLDGKMCCSSNMEDKIPSPYSTKCDGSVIRLDSKCCQQNRYTPCLTGTCVNYVGVNYGGFGDIKKVKKVKKAKKAKKAM